MGKTKTWLPWKFSLKLFSTVKLNNITHQIGEFMLLLKCIYSLDNTGVKMQMLDAFLHFIITLLPFTRAGFLKQTNIFRSYTQASHNWLFIVSYSCHSNQVATSKLTWYSHLLFQFLMPSSKLNETPAKIRQHVFYLFDPKFIRFKPLDKALKVE